MQNRIIISVIGLTCLFAVSQAMAQNVAVPYTPPNEAQPKLGLMPTETLTKPDTLLEPSEKPIEQNTVAPAPIPMPKVVLPSDDLDSANIKPPSLKDAKSPEGIRAALQDVLRQQKAAISKSETSVIDLPDAASQTVQTENTDLPFSLNISANLKAWGRSDIDSVSQVTGYSAKEVAQKCTLTTQGTIDTDSGRYTIFPSDQSQNSANYKGVIKNVSIMPVAACIAPSNTPKMAGMIMRQNGKYLIPLSSVAICKVEEGQKAGSQIAYKYAGDNKSSCQFD